MRRPLRTAISWTLVSALFIAVVAPSADARPRPELTGCKGECKKTERRCDGDCQKVHSRCATQCGCPTGHKCTETERTCFGTCNLRMNACMNGCRGVFTRCASKCG